MKTIINNMMLVLLLFSSFVIIAQNEKDIQAKIVVDQNDNFVNITATAINKSDLYKEEITYKIIALKRSEKGNLSKNAQSGIFSMKPNETVSLSSQKMNIDSGSYIDIYLYLKKNGVVISKDTLSIGDIKKKYSIIPVEETELEITGIVIDNVFSREAKEFYEFYGNISRISQVNYPFIITINEKPFFGGRNSVVSILINNVEIYTFRTLPKQDYLYAAAQETHKQILKYYKKNEELWKEEMHY